MKCFQGAAVGIEEPTLVRVYTGDSAGGSGPGRVWGLARLKRSEDGISLGILAEGEANAGPYLDFQDKPELLHHGDVLLVETSGRCTVLYEAGTDDNVLLMTERCNNRCLICSQPPKSEDNGHSALSRSTLELIEEAPASLCLTGGEPTLAWEGLISLVRRCRERFPETGIQILTNGRRLRDFDLANHLVEAGGDALYVSVPLYADVAAVHDEIVGTPGAFWETLAGIYNLARLKVFVEIRNVVIRQNFEGLPRWSEFVYRSLPFAGHVAIMGLEPIGLAAANIDRVWIDPVDYREQLLSAFRVLKRCGMETSLFNHQLCTLPRALWPDCASSISSWKRMFLPACANCAERQSCGGLFHSAGKYHSRAIAAISAEAGGLREG